MASSSSTVEAPPEPEQAPPAPEPAAPVPAPQGAPAEPPGAEPAYPGQAGPAANPVSEELLHRAIRSNVELAERVGLSPSPCLRRVRLLEEAGVINRYVALLNAVVERQAALIARWMQLGFIHGVMNTDNCSISGETIEDAPVMYDAPGLAR